MSQTQASAINTHSIRIRFWFGRGFWAVADQALFAGSNFVVGVLLARWLEPAAFGAFSTAFASYLLLATLHTSLWTEPMMIYGSGKYRQVFRGYQRILVAAHWKFGVMTALLFATLGALLWTVGQIDLGKSFMGLAVAAPLVLYLCLARRGAYVLLEPRMAAYGGGLYLILYIGVIALLQKNGLLGVTTALISMGLAALAAGVWVSRRVWSSAETFLNAPTNAEVSKVHWNYGRWALLAGALSWVPINIYYIALPMFHGLEAAAGLKALLNLVMPAMNFNFALGSLLPAVFVRAREQGRLVHSVLVGLVGLLFFSLFYWALLVLAGQWLMQWLYVGKYEGSELLVWVGLMPVAGAFVVAFGSMFRALERPRLIAMVYMITAVFSLTLGIYATYYWALAGAIGGIVVANIITATMLTKMAMSENDQ
jgi:O-antigen/teichoic acid export membrane protein